eukprot:gene12506-8562_t
MLPVSKKSSQKNLLPIYPPARIVGEHFCLIGLSFTSEVAELHLAKPGPQARAGPNLLDRNLLVQPPVFPEFHLYSLDATYVCYLKKLAQWESADPSTRGQAPKDPSTVNWKGEGLSKDQQNDQQFKEFVNNLEPCPHCGRKFLAERLVVHLRSCKPGSSSKPVGAQRPTSPGALSGDSSTGGPKTPPEPGEPSSRPTKKPSPSARLSKTIPQGIDPKRNRLPSNSEAEVGIQCIQCGAVEYDEKAKFCRDCGRNLRAKNLPDPCPGCGELIIEGSSFCPTCGQPVAKAPGLVDERTPKKELHVESPSVRMAHCPACRALCDADGNFCDNCGAALGDTEPVATTTNTKGTASEVELYCTTCDEVCEIENAIFCEECGEKLIQRAKASGLNEKRSSVLSGPQPTPAVKKREKTVLSEPEIQEPPPKRSVGKPVNTARVPESSEGEEAPQSQLIECYNCGRKFCEEALGRHQRICLNTKKRPVFDVSKQRLKELEAAPVSKSGRGSIASKAASAPPKKDWKTESENLRKCLREARLADQIIKSGGDLRDLPPPSYSENPDYVQCPHCERRVRRPGIGPKHHQEGGSCFFRKRKQMKKNNNEMLIRRRTPISLMLHCACYKAGTRMTTQQIISSLRRIIEVVQTNDSCATLLTDVQQWISTFHALNSEVCLTAEEAFAAQQCGQILWNSLVSSIVPIESAVKCELQYCATLAYLFGNYFFARNQIRDSYFQCHSLEGEKCVLLCLKTCRTLSLNGKSDVAQTVLTFATTIRAKCFWSKNKSSQFDIELLFAEMAVHKDLGQWKETLEKAKTVVALSSSRPPQKEALLHFIYKAAESPPLEKESEFSLRQLLSLSIDLQKGKFPMSFKEKSLLGVTHLQQGLSFFRSSDFESALVSSGVVSTQFNCVEALILKTLSLLCLKRYQDALESFAALIRTQKLGLDDSFSLAFAVADAYIDGTEEVILLLRGIQVANSSKEEFNFYFFSFLLHFFSTKRVLQNMDVLDNVSTDGLYSHAFFNLLWSMGQRPELTAAEKLLLMHRAMDFSSHSMQVEVEGLATMMGQVAIDECKNNHSEGMLELSYEVFQKLKAPCSSLFSKVVWCQLAFLLKKDTTTTLLHDLLSHPDDDLVHACGALLIFFLEKDALSLAAQVGRHALNYKSQKVEDKVSFLKVYCLSLVHSQPNDICGPDAQLVLDNFSCVWETAEVQQNPLWWCQFLWHMSDLVEKSQKRMALQFSSVAVELWIKSKISEKIEECFINRLHLLLDWEFDAFVSGSCVLSVHQLSSYHSQLNGAVICASPSVFLSKCELLLRSLESGSTTIEECTAFIAPSSLRLTACSVDDIEALSVSLIATASSLQLTELQRCAIDVLLFCATEFPCVDKKSLYDSLRCFYRAYTECRSIDQQHNVCMALLTCLRNIPSTSECFSGLNESSAQNVVEFFSVESWNMAVRFNTVRDSKKVEQWKFLSHDLSLFLCNDNYTKEILENFLQTMPFHSSAIIAKNNNNLESKYIYILHIFYNAVTAEDIVEWLGFLDKIDDVKLQFDPFEKKVCYSVHFRHSQAVHQAVCHLNGERLKNCPVRIKSEFYSPPDTPESAHETPSVKPTASEKGTEVNVSLPHNTLVPKEFSMSEPLISFISQVGSDQTFQEGNEAVNKLKFLQEKWCKTDQELKSVSNRLKDVNDILRDISASRSDREALTQNSSGRRSFTTTSSLTMSPDRLLSAITEVVGPVSHYHCTATNSAFRLTFTLMMEEDSEMFVKLCSPTATGLSLRENQIASVQWVTTDSPCYTFTSTSAVKKLCSLLTV